MATAHTGLDSLSKYLRSGFAWKEEWVCEKLGMVFTYPEVKEALRRLKRTDPKLHRLLEYRWLSNRTRSEIANALYMDGSTLKRTWDKAMHIVVNWLVHGIQDDLVEELQSLDIMEYD